jgi:hypothetical protein
MRSVMVCTPHQILFERSYKNIRWVEHVARTRERRGTCRVLVGKPNGKIATGRPRRRREDDIKGSSRSGMRRHGLD